MTSHALGPFLLADRPLTEAEIAALEGAASWSIGMLPPFTAMRVVFDARPQAHHGRQQGTTVVLSRARAEALTLPRRHNASPIPQGSNGTPASTSDGYYGDSYYGEIWYGE